MLENKLYLIGIIIGLIVVVIPLLIFIVKRLKIIYNILLIIVLLIPFMAYYIINQNNALLDYEKLNLQRVSAASNLSSMDTVKIGVTYDFSNNENRGFIQGVRLAVETLNNKNNNTLLDNKKIELVEKDTKSNPTIALEIAKEFAKDKNIIAVVSNSIEDIAQKVAIVYEYSGIIYMSTTATSPNFTRNNFNMIFRNIPDDISMAKSLSQLAGRLNFKNIVIIHSNNKRASYIAQVFIDNSSYLGLNIKYRISFKDSDYSFEHIVDSISPLKHKYLDYDAILVLGEIDNAPLLIKALRIKGIYAPIITGDNLNSPKLLNIGEAANNVIVPTYFNLEILNEITQNFISFYQEKHNKLPDTYSVQGYDSIMVLKTAINNCNCLVPKYISESLKYLNNHISVGAKYSINTKGDVVDKKIFFNKITDQKFKFLSIK